MADAPKTSDRGPFTRAGETFDEALKDALPRVEAEVKKVVQYINDRVVPEVRRDSTDALRAAAEQLRKLADYMESAHKKSGGDSH